MKNLKKWALRTLAALLALAMLIGVPAGPRGRAAAEVTGQDGGAAEMGIRLVSGLISTIVEATPEAAVAAVVEWGIGEILEKAFGSDMSEEERQYFNQILSEIAKLQDSVSTLQTTLELQGLDSLLNSYKNLASNQTPSVIYRALLRIDEAEATEEWKRQERLSLLTDSIGAGEGNLADIDLPFDQYANAILNAMTTTYNVSLDGRSLKLPLLQIHYEYLRRTYFWEHQAIDEWYGFQCRAMGILVETLTVEKLSLQARLERIRQHNLDHPESHIATAAVEVALGDVQTGLNTVKRMYADKSKWIPQPHPEDERYYWVPGHEMVFYAEVNSQLVPEEERRDIGVAWTDWMDYLKGIRYTSGAGYCCPVWSFWKPFFRPGPTRLTTKAELETIFHDYELKKQRKSFYEIFIDENEGNFQGLTGDAGEDWVMVFDPEAANLECHMHMDSHLDYYYTVEAWFLNAKKEDGLPAPAKQKIYWYMSGENHPTDKTCFIGLRVKTVSDSQPAIGKTHAVSGGDVLPCGWVLPDGDLPIWVDSSAMGAVQSVSVDGAAAQYSRTGDGVSVSESTLRALSAGVHTMIVHGDNGTMTLTIHIGPALGLALPMELTALEEGSFANIGAKSVQINDDCTVIGANAFADNADLAWVYIPDSVKQIGEGAFANCPNLVLICGRGSTAESYAKANGIPYRFIAR